MEKIYGVVERITYQNQENGFSVIKFNQSQNSLHNPFDNSKITAIIFSQSIFKGASLELKGEWILHPEFGRQFKVSSFVEQKPVSIKALEKYIGSGLIYGVGPKTAQKIVNHFKENTLEVFENKVERLLEVPGIASKKLDFIKESWSKHKDLRDIMLYFQEANIGLNLASKIYKKYQKDTLRILKENPYQLADDIYGFGFLSADSLALSSGITKDAKIRIKAGILYTLNDSFSKGHCFKYKDQIYNDVKELLNLTIDHSFFEKILEELIFEGKLINHNHNQYYSKELFFAEDFVAKNISIRLKLEKEQAYDDVNEWLTKFNLIREFPLSEEQQEVIKKIVQHKFSILTGGPGCGKTTTILSLFEYLKFKKKNILLAAPTGRAAQRMSEVIKTEVKTIHRLLEYSPITNGFLKNNENKLIADFIILDECSMLDIKLAKDLLSAIDINTQILFIGDKDQLPSVGPGNVLNDLIDVSLINVQRLTKIFRQAKESSIIDFAHLINKGLMGNLMSPFEFPDLFKNNCDLMFIDSKVFTKEDEDFILKFRKNENIEIPEKYKNINLEKLKSAANEVEELKALYPKISPYSCLNWNLTAKDMIISLYKNIIPKYFSMGIEIQILTPMTKGSMGVNNLNHIIQENLNPLEKLENRELNLFGKKFRINDRVIQKRNNYDLGVFNGDIGKIVHIDLSNQSLQVEYESKENGQNIIYERENINELDLAYAITIHKSQGSEFDIIILPIFTQHYNMLFRNLIYTGLTRAKKLAIFIGSKKALNMAIQQINFEKRQTNLEKLISTF